MSLRTRPKPVDVVREATEVIVLESFRPWMGRMIERGERFPRDHDLAKTFPAYFGLLLPLSERCGLSWKICSGCSRPFQTTGKKGSRCPACSRVYERERSRTRRQRRVRSGGRWQQARAAARKRDGERCRRCGTADNLEVHHVVGLAEGGQPYALANLVTLCTECHRAVETRGTGRRRVDDASHPGTRFSRRTLR
jgi:5-methylcytosine-specific restriction endonuclease McrA